MTGLSQALQDIRKFLNIKNAKNIEVDYDVVLLDEEMDKKTKSVELTFNNKKHGYIATITRVRLRKMLRKV